MSTSALIIAVFAVLGAASLAIFIYCAWSDKHDSGSHRN